MPVTITPAPRPYSEKDMACAVAALSEGATWKQIYQMFPNSTRQLTAFGDTARQIGGFCRKWVPDWSPSFRMEAAMMRAALRNYIQQNDPNYYTPEWMAN